MTIEQRLLHDYGTTTNFEMATWMLADGTLVNGSIQGCHRDIDHRCISEYFKRSKYEDPGSASIYLMKFMRRGNIRVSCNEFAYGFEFCKTPTEAEIKNIFRAHRKAIQNAIPFHIDRKVDAYHTKSYNFDAFTEYLLRYTNLLQTA